jgi:hypothetical protein
MFIRVIATPPGEAPEEVRRAWIGLTLPLAVGETGPRLVRGWGVLSGPRTFLGSLLAQLASLNRQEYGYVVDAAQALALLAECAPWAAQWWRECAPHSVAPGRRFIFVAEVCAEVGATWREPAHLSRRASSQEFYPAGPAEVTRIPHRDASRAFRIGPRTSDWMPPTLTVTARGQTCRVEPTLLTTGMRRSVRWTERSADRAEIAPSRTTWVLGLEDLFFALLIWAATTVFLCVRFALGPAAFSLGFLMCSGVVLLLLQVKALHYAAKALLLLTWRTSIDRSAGLVRTSVLFRAGFSCRTEEVIAVQVVRRFAAQPKCYQVNLVLSGPGRPRISLAEHDARDEDGREVLHIGRRLARFLGVPLVDQLDTMTIQEPSELADT